MLNDERLLAPVELRDGDCISVPDLVSRTWYAASVRASKRTRPTPNCC